MHLDPSLFRYLNEHDWNVLFHIEKLSRKVAHVPEVLIVRHSPESNSATTRAISTCHRLKLLSHTGVPCSAFRLTSLGADFLAVRAILDKVELVSIGPQVGVGKEADIHICAMESGQQVVLKLHRLGRTSFRKGVHDKRDYEKGQGAKGPASWHRVSRESARAEAHNLVIAYEGGLRVPKLLAHSRHCILMTVAPGVPLNQFHKVDSSETTTRLYGMALGFILDLAAMGYVHCDINEFNLILDDADGQLDLTLLDFPQMIPVTHRDAAEMFDRDVANLVAFFRRRFHFDPDEVPTWSDVVATNEA